MRVSLLFPPQWTAAQPPFALASLNGQLREAGHDVRIWDLNLEFAAEALSERGIRLHWKRLRSRRELLEGEARLRLAFRDRSARLASLGGRLKEIDALLTDGWEEALVERCAQARATLAEREEFYDPHRFIAAQLAFDEALRLVSAPYQPSAVRWNDFSSPRCELNFEPILEFCRSPSDNLFRPFYRHWVPRVLAERPEVIAISINAFSQLLPGLTLAEMLKNALAKRPRVHLSLGGNFFSRLREVLLRRPEFFRVFADSVILGEGEGPLLELVHVLTSGGRSLMDVSNLIFLGGAGRVEATEASTPGPMGDLAFQDFAGFPLERYLAPERVACIRSSKGCTWNRCAFCDAHYGHSSDSLEVERLVAELEFLRDRYGIRHFEFVDECIDPSYLHLMCDTFIRADLRIRWFCNARTEPGFTPALLKKMSRAGATMILWGIESGSPRLLKLMRKGVAASKRIALLRAAAEAGLWNFAYVFFGFPSETREEAEATIDLICGNTDVIHSYGRSVFTLGRHSPLMREPEAYGILEYVEDDQEFSTNLRYKSASGIQGQELVEVGRSCAQRCRQTYQNPLWMALRSRETLHLYLARHGTQWVRDHELKSARAASTEFMF